MIYTYRENLTRDAREFTSDRVYQWQLLLKEYNRNIILPHDPATPWEKKQQMKQTDPVHSLKLFIAHNAPPKAIPNAGSSIFFHIWRSNGTRPS